MNVAINNTVKPISLPPVSSVQIGHSGMMKMGPD
jgi:hypothetical protein